MALNNFNYGYHEYLWDSNELLCYIGHQLHFESADIVLLERMESMESMERTLRS